MNFLPIDLCKELQSAGIVNESGFVYEKASRSGEWLVVYSGGIRTTEFREIYPAYVAEIAFLGPSETAKENARKWFGDQEHKEGKYRRAACWCKNSVYEDIFAFCFDTLRHELNDLDTTRESVEDFLRRTRAK